MDAAPDSWFAEQLAETIRRERGTWREEVRRKYPNWMSRLRWGFEHGEGWRLITEQLFADLSALLGADALKLKVCQVKSKVGGYCFYADTENLSDEQRSAIEEQIAAADEDARRTCETCGQPGELVRDRGWWHVACPQHATRNFG